MPGADHAGGVTILGSLGDVRTSDRPAGAWPHTAATAGSNSCPLQATLDVDSGRIVVVSALDNLGKGAAGQAVQCANIMLGLPETAGLSVYGVAP